MKCIMQTATGRLVDLYKIQATDICLDDIADALSRVVRFGGHSLGTTVLHHVRLVGYMLELTGATPYQQLLGLLHDSEEAYIGDMPSPLKKHPDMQGYVKLGNSIRNVVYQSFGIPLPKKADQKVIDAADAAALYFEAEAYMPRVNTDWQDKCRETAEDLLTESMRIDAVGFLSGVVRQTRESCRNGYVTKVERLVMACSRNS